MNRDDFLKISNRLEIIRNITEDVRKAVVGGRMKIAAANTVLLRESAWQLGKLIEQLYDSQGERDV